MPAHPCKFCRSAELAGESAAWCAFLRPVRTRSPVRSVEQVDLPQVLRARVNERLQCAHAGFSNALLERSNFLELRAKRRIGLGLEPRFAHQQNPLCFDSKLGA